jgi:hypothetical protein
VDAGETYFLGHSERSRCLLRARRVPPRRRGHLLLRCAEDFQRSLLEIVASFLESCGCGPLTTDWNSSEELPETDTWQFVEALSRWRSVRVVVHSFTADSRIQALRRDMVWVDVSSRVLRGFEQVPLGINTIFDFTVQTLPRLPYSH